MNPATRVLTFPNVASKGWFFLSGRNWMIVCLVAALAAHAGEPRSGDRRMGFLTISTADLFAAMDLEIEGLGDVRTAVSTGNWLKAGEAWGQYWASRVSPRYPVDPESYSKGVSQHLPTIRKVVIADADEAWERDFAHATYKPKRDGTAFVWVDQNPDTAYIGFLYFFWVKNLGRAYALTGDEKYAEMFRDIVCSFWDAIPDFDQASCGSHKGVDILWNSGLGSSLRCTLMMDCYWLMRGSPSFTPELHTKMLKIFLSHGRYIFATHMRAYNHSNFQASQSAWMVTAGVLLPEFREVLAWRTIGVQRTRERIARNFDEDGAQIEQSPQYHLTGMRDITRLLMVLHANGMEDVSADKALWGKMERVYDYTIRITHSTGHLGVFNSGVYGTEAQVFFPVGMRLFGSELHAWASKRFIQPDFVPVAKRVSEYVMFMDGAWAQSLQDAQQMSLTPPPETSELMSDSGVAILRSGWDKNACSLVFDFNRKPWGGHRHFGRLSFDLFAHGSGMVVNPGSTMSYSMPVYRRWCYQTIGHNTVLVSGKSHSDHRAELAAWHAGEHVTLVSARMETQGVAFQRTIVSVPDEYFFFSDRLSTSQDDIPLAWLLHTPLAISQRPDGALCSAPGQAGLLVMPDSRTLTESEIVLAKGFSAVPVSYHDGYQPEEGWRDDVPYLRINSTTSADDGGRTYGVLLAPFADTPPDVGVLTQEREGVRRHEMHSVLVRRASITDQITIDYRPGEPFFRIVRRDADGRVLWDEQ
ncbi:MAG: alginate lyase family protein [Lentisphaerae bacterium]|nr:alginate lyase family protein [Lentisphaerota bacterium]MBT5606175.1 alginate lyase family protein [Lentisphaerota bacterium]MBT7057879.1 alginate lyase family protein [Lentisphaerota bacterium]MBT7841727.1 alginate lyase family protein [Lentisphaerota bacterium]